MKMKTLFGLMISLSSITVCAESLIKISAQQQQTLGIELAVPQTAAAAPLLRAAATVTVPPANDHLVSAAYPGLLQSIKVNPGDSVVKNQLLAVINSPELLSLQQQHLSALNDLHLDKAEYMRVKQLHQEGLIAERRRQQSQIHYQVSLARYSETGQMLSLAGMNKAAIRRLEKNRTLKPRLNVYAPDNGVIIERRVSIGERIDAAAPLFRLVNLQTLWLDIQAPQQKTASLKNGQQVAIEGSAATATVFLLGQYVNPRNQTVLVRAKLDQANAGIRLGQTLNVSIADPFDGSVFKAPNSAIAQIEGQAYVFKQIAEGFSLIPVHIIGRDNGASFIQGNIAETDRWAIRGAVALKGLHLGLGEGE